MMTRNILPLLGVFAALVAADVAPNLRTRQLEEPLEFIQDGNTLISDYTSNSTTATQDHRRMQKSRTVLVVRVINSGVGPSVSAATIRQYTFTDVNSVKAQMMRCSSNNVLLTEARYGTNGVIDVPVNTAMNAADLMNAAREAAPRYIGVTDIRSAADHVMFILPKISDYFAEAETGHGLSYYNDHFGVSLAVVMHELGHNLGLYHSGLVGDEYGDYSGYMGLALVKRGGPLMCYNAANHWDRGWYSSNRLDLGSSGPAKPMNLALNGYTNAPMVGPVLLKVAGNVYLQYHHASKHNIDAFQEFANKVVVVQKTGGGSTIRLASLGPGEEYKTSSFAIRACAARQSGALNYMDISIGRSSTNCANSVLLAPPPVPAPVPRPAPTPSSNWGNMNPSPTAPTSPTLSAWNWTPSPPSPPAPTPPTLSAWNWTPSPPTVQTTSSWTASSWSSTSWWN